MSLPRSPVTRAVRAGIAQDAAFGAVVPPIYLSANYTFAGFDDKRAYDYTRTRNPTRDVLAQALADLEGAAGTVVTASGMAAIHLVTRLVRRGERVLAPHDCYGGTYRLLTALAARDELGVEFVDTGDEHALTAALGRGARMLWLETPSNPLLRITDIAAAARVARRHGALVVADNTFLSPALQQPLALGADLVVHSTTKYLNGHSDVVGGAVCVRDAALLDELEWWANCIGAGGAPFDAFLTLRGVRTLDARMRVHEENTRVVAELLAGSDVVGRVHWPGLATHPGHRVAARQQRGFGGMLSFELACPAASAAVPAVPAVPAVRAFLDGLRCFSLAESLGGVESLVAHPATMTHAAMPAEARARAGIVPSLLRLSVGIEAAADLTRDLEAGLARVAAITAHAKALHSPRGDILSRAQP